MNVFSLLELNKIWKKLAAGAVITVIVTMVTMNYVSHQINNYYAEEDFNKEMKSLIDVASDSLKEPLWNLNDETLISICDSFFQHDTVSRIVVKDATLGLVYDRKSYSEIHADDLLVSIEKDIIHHDRVIGTIELSMTKYFISQEEMRSIQKEFLEMIIVIVLLMIVLMIVVRRITRPLTDLKQALHLVATSNEIQTIEISSNDEVGQLAASFNQMSQDIFEARAAIHKLNEELEEKVENRTSELNQMNEELSESLTIIEKTKQELLTSNDDLSRTLKELQEVQELLIESGKMALLGELVAGVAHEINTPVGVSLTMSSYIEAQVRQLSSKIKSNNLSKQDFLESFEKLEESSSLIVRNLLRAGELISSFKQVAVDQTSHSIRRFNFHDYINETLLNLKSHYKHRNIEIINNCPDDLEIVSYPGAYAQIFTNLIMNSLIHAFDEDDNGLIEIIVQVSDEKLDVLFKDDGKGISPENIKKVFNPFYTTKRGQGGTGLGLNITYNIAFNVLKGSILCQSVLGEGTSFVMNLPLHHPDIDEEMY